jgi:hypothetical protein
MINNRNRISTKDTIKATSFDINGKIISSIYDSRFSSIRQVISALTTKAGWLKKIKYITIYNEDKCWSENYLPSGRKI